MKELTIQELRLKARTRSNKIHKISPVEQSIITIQQYFLTPGTHCIQVSTVQQGRSLLRICLDSLQVFGDVALLTVANQRCPALYRDLYKEMAEAHVLGISDGSLEEFILTSFYNDFLVIEYTKELMDQPWFGRFEQLLSRYSINQSIPIILFMYEAYELEAN